MKCINIDMNELILVIEEARDNISFRYGIFTKNNIDSELLERIETMLNKLKEESKE